MAIVVVASLVGACRSAATPPDTVVDPQIVGLWVSEEGIGSNWHVTLDTGDAVDIDPRTMQLALSNGGGRQAGTLIMFGRGPAAEWWGELNLSDTAVGYPVGCYAIGGNAYQIGDSIVFRARADTAPNGHEADFGIRLPKAPDMDPPPAHDAPWFGYFADLCVDAKGIVTQIRPPAGP
jgi:hypothetical protein